MAQPAEPRPLTLAACAAAVVLLAFFFNRLCGLHFFAIDTASLIIDGSYRVHLGQAPFRDFLCPIGPVLFWLTALAFRWFGVTYASYVGLGSVMNAAAAGMVFWTAWRKGRDLGAASAAAAVTAVWLMPVSLGGPTYTSGAFFFVVVAACLLLGRDPDPSSSPIEAGVPSGQTLAAGAALAGAFSIKQPVGLFAAFFLGLYALRAGSYRRAGLLAAGFFLGLAALALAVGPAGWANAWRHFFYLPLVEGLLGRFLRHKGTGAWLVACVPFMAILLRKGDRPLTASAACLSLAYLLGGASIREGMSAFIFLPLAALPFMDLPLDRAMMIALTLTGFCSSISAGSPLSHSVPLFGLQHFLACRGWKRWHAGPADNPWRQALAGGSSWAGDMPVWAGCAFLAFLGLRSIAMTRWNALWIIPVVGPAIGLASLWAGLRLLARRRLFGDSRRSAIAAGLVGVLTGLALIGRGISSALDLSREPAMVADRDSISRPVMAPFFRGLKLPREEAQALDLMADYLSGLPSQAKPFFIYQEETGTTLYAALDQAPPQPFISFDPGLAYSGPRDESKACEALGRAGVRTVGISDGGGGLGSSAPACLKRWLREDFVLDRRAGDLVFYRRRDASP